MRRGVGEGDEARPACYRAGAGFSAGSDDEEEKTQARNEEEQQCHFIQNLGFHPSYTLYSIRDSIFVIKRVVQLPPSPRKSYGFRQEQILIMTEEKKNDEMFNPVAKPGLVTRSSPVSEATLVGMQKIGK